MPGQVTESRICFEAVAWRAIPLTICKRLGLSSETLFVWSCLRWCVLYKTSVWADRCDTGVAEDLYSFGPLAGDLAG